MNMQTYLPSKFQVTTRVMVVRDLGESQEVALEEIEAEEASEVIEVASEVTEADT